MVLTRRPVIAMLPAVALLLALRSWQAGTELGADATSFDATSADAVRAGELEQLHASSGAEPRLPDTSDDDGWRAFRRDHPKVAKVSEYGLMWILQRWQLNPSQHDLTHTCMRSGVPFPELSISASVRLRDRGLAIEDIDCAPERSGDNYAEQFCSCLLSGLAPDNFVELSSVELSDADFANYEGRIVLDHLTLQ